MGRSDRIGGRPISGIFLNKTAPNVTPIVLLLIDDDDSDVFLTRRALKKCATPTHVLAARDGEEALSVLRREPPHEEVPRPDLIFLDLNMPRMNGHELLDIIKADDDLKSIPVIVMTMSQSDADMMKSYQGQASSYVAKPIELEAFTKVIQAIEAYWFAAARLPQQRPG